MKLFGPIEENNTGQMVPQARSIREGNDTNAAAARNSIQNTELRVRGDLSKVCSSLVFLLKLKRSHSLAGWTTRIMTLSNACMCM